MYFALQTRYNCPGDQLVRALYGTHQLRCLQLLLLLQLISLHSVSAVSVVPVVFSDIDINDQLIPIE